MLTLEVVFPAQKFQIYISKDVFCVNILDAMFAVYQGVALMVNLI